MHRCKKEVVSKKKGLAKVNSTRTYAHSYQPQLQHQSPTPLLTPSPMKPPLRLSIHISKQYTILFTHLFKLRNRSRPDRNDIACIKRCKDGACS